MLRRISLVAVLVLASALTESGTALATSRPTEPGPGAFGVPGYQVAEEPPVCNDEVCVHWVSTTQDAPRDARDLDEDGTPDGLAKLAVFFERALEHQTGSDPDELGWRAPLSDGDLGGDARTDVYVQDLRGTASGVAPRDDGQGVAYQAHGFIVLDRSFVAPDPGRGVEFDLVPHELSHLVQYAYDSYFESWHAEATAEWMAAELDPSPASLDTSARGWAVVTAEPLLSRRRENGYPTLKAYYAAVWLRWLAERHGRDAVRAIWERGGERAPFSLHPVAVDAALSGSSSFVREFTDFAAANAEWRVAGSGFGASGNFADVERKGTLADGVDAEVTLDHTAFALLDVPVRSGKAVAVRLTAPAGTNSAVALVGRRDGRVKIERAPLPEGGSAAVSLPDPARYERITAVLVNADPELANGGRKDSTGQWVYARDDQAFTVRATLAEEATPPSGPDPSPPDPGPAPQSQGTPAAPPLVGSDPGPSAPSRPQPPPVPAADRVAPSVRILRIVSPRRRANRAPRTRIVLASSEACVATFDVVVGGRVVARRRVRLERGRRTVSVALARRLRGRRATLRLAAIDPSGNVARGQRRFAVR